MQQEKDIPYKEKDKTTIQISSGDKKLLELKKDEIGLSNVGLVVEKLVKYLDKIKK